MINHTILLLFQTIDTFVQKNNYSTCTDEIHAKARKQYQVQKLSEQ